MNFVINKKLFDIDYMYVMEPVSNNIYENGVFHRIIYSNSIMTLNSLIFKFTFHNISVVKNFNKYKLSFDPFNDNNINIINFINTLESDILNKFNLGNKHSKCIIDSINNDSLKIYTEKTLSTNYDIFDVYLKISGIWMKDNVSGITFKFSC